MNAVAAGLGAVIDHAVGEPPTRVHPVAAFGSLMQRVERCSYADRHANGIAHAALGAAVAVAVGCVSRRVLGHRLATVVAVAACSAGRMLDDEAGAMSQLLRDDDLDTARVRVRALVGRRAESLGVDELARAVIESVAENSVDAVTATLWWAAVAGAPGAYVHRAINTLDAMVGHRTERYEHFGWAAARCDDALNYLPARATALATVAVVPRCAKDIVATVRRDAPRHPSPNGGVIEAAYAAALGLTLGGVNRYDDELEDRGTLGNGRSPAVDDIAAAVRLRRRSTAVFVIALIAVQAVTGCRWRRP